MISNILQVASGTCLLYVAIQVYVAYKSHK